MQGPSPVGRGLGTARLGPRVTAPCPLAPPRRQGSVASSAATSKARRSTGKPARVPLRPTCRSGLAHPGEEAQQQDSSRSHLPIFLSVPLVTVARGGGGGGGGGSERMGSSGSLGMQVMERAGKINIIMPSPVVHGPKLDDSGSGGDSGNNKGIGGGDGSGNGGDDDDDDYAFNEGEGDGEGDGFESFFKTVLPELYDPASVGAVLAEWCRTVSQLPLFIARAISLGLFSSAQLTRFMALDVRPGLARAVSRSLPVPAMNELVGRLTADPGFFQKLVFEATLASVSSLLYEWQARGANFKKELDLVAINTLGMAVASATALWLVAPCRAVAFPHRFPWQNMLQDLPNCVFDASTRGHRFAPLARAQGWLAKMAELAGVGAVMGGATAALSHGAVALRRVVGRNARWEPSVPVPNLWDSSAGLAAFFAINAHTRYQLVGGMDRYLFDHSNSLLTYLGINLAARIASNRVGEAGRPSAQGLPDSRFVAARQQRRARLAAQAAAAQPPSGRRQRRLRSRALGDAAAMGAAPLAVAPASSAAAASSSPAASSAGGGQQSGVRAVPADAEREAFGPAVVGQFGAGGASQGAASSLASRPAAVVGSAPRELPASVPAVAAAARSGAGSAAGVQQGDGAVAAAAAAVAAMAKVRIQHEEAARQLQHA